MLCCRNGVSCKYLHVPICVSIQSVEVGFASFDRQDKQMHSKHIGKILKLILNNIVLNVLHSTNTQQEFMEKFLSAKQD